MPCLANNLRASHLLQHTYHKLTIGKGIESSKLDHVLLHDVDNLKASQTNLNGACDRPYRRGRLEAMASRRLRRRLGVLLLRGVAAAPVGHAICVNEAAR